MNNPLISVIIPVYNVEEYLDKCVESVVNQTYQNLEIILVDDGSPDRCPAMCDAWAEKDARICVIHKENGGLSSARNAGLDVCRGEYISFVDSDDWIDRDMIYLLLEACNSDYVMIAACGRYEHFERSKKIKVNICPEKREIVDTKDFVADMLKGHNCDSSSCDKIYHRLLWEDIRFPMDRIYEDVAIMYKVVLKSPYIATIDKPLYHYFRHSGSIVTSGFSEKLFDYPTNTRKLMEDIKENYPELLEYASWTHTKALIRVLDKLSRANRKTYLKYHKEFRELQMELASMAGIWKTSLVFSKRDKRESTLFSMMYMPYVIGNLKKVVYRVKKRIR